jgi:cell division cycle protein 20 (cofactor of APC complex)
MWRYPSLEKIISLPGHALRPMHLALSPDGQTVASLGDDESLKFWKCFPFQKGRKGTKSDVDVVPGLTIR